MSDYSLVLPPPWRHIPLRSGTEKVVDSLADEALATLPAEVPPDQVAQARIKLREPLLARLNEAREKGAIDFFLPIGPVNGFPLATTFVVGESIPDAMATIDDVGPAMAAVIAEDPTTRPVEVGGVTWLRSEGLEETTDPDSQEPLRARRVQYMTAVPSDPRRWFIVTCTSFGDGDPHSDFTGLMIELFDAIMSTWRWLELPERQPEEKQLV